jgi:hypothetical protein
LLHTKNIKKEILHFINYTNGVLRLYPPLSDLLPQDHEHADAELANEPHRMPLIPQLLLVAAWLEFLGVVVAHDDEGTAVGLNFD